MEKSLSVRVKLGGSDHRAGSRDLVDDLWFLDRRLVSTGTIFITTRDAQHYSYPSPFLKACKLSGVRRPLRATEGYSRSASRHKATTKADGRKGRRVSNNGSADMTWDHGTVARRRNGLWVYPPKEVWRPRVIVVHIIGNARRK